MKSGAKISLIFLSFLATSFLTVGSYADCKEKCNYLRRSSCNIEKANQSADSDCCHSAQKSSSEKCKGACCINNLPPTATVDGQAVAFDIVSVYCVFENPVFVELNFNLEAAVLSTGPPFCPRSNTQAVLCVFVI